MVEITVELLKRRAEHNDGELSTLEEITLHQFDIEKIQLLQDICRNLKILYLQSNQIGKIGMSSLHTQVRLRLTKSENLGRLKSLEYLNLALNNIQKIENLQGCESLRKLDLTMNFVIDLESVASLTANSFLRELYLTGNPCTSISGYRSYVIATLPQLQSLDGVEITRTERIKAAHEYATIKVESVEEQDKESQNEVKLDENGEVLVPHTPEARLQYARELAAKRGQNDRTSQTKPNNIQPKRDTNPKFHPETNRILQRNDAELEFQWREFPNHVVLDLSFSKTIDTSLIDLDIHPTWITVEYKGKALHLATPCEVRVSDSTAQRSQITGHLVLTMPRVQIDPHLARLMPDAESGAQTFTGYVAGRKSPEKRNDLPSLTKKPWNQSGALRVREVRRTPVVPDSQFTDDPEVPPLI